MRRLLWLVALLLFLPSLSRAQGGQVTLIRASVEPLPNCTPAVVGQPEPQIWDITAQVVKYCTAPNTWTGSSIPTIFYQTLERAGVAQTQRPAFNFIPSTNMTIAVADNPGNGSTDVTFSATSTAATAFSALTPSVNNTAGTFGFSGNTLDLTNAAAFNLPKLGVGVPGSASGSSTLSPPATGSFTWLLPSGSGTFAVAALSPITISAAGVAACATCNTTNATVSSVNLTQTGSIFNFSGGPILTAGAINIAFASQAQNLFLASPSGAPGALAVRAIVGADLPAINLAVSGAGGVTGILPKANALSTAVYTDQANTYSAGAQNFASAASLTLPTSAGAAPAGAGQIAYDSTNARLSVNLNGTVFVIPWVASGTPSNLLCADWLGTGGQLGSTTCGTGGGGGSGTINTATQFAFPYYSTVGTASTLSGVPSPTTNGNYLVSYFITGGVASAPVVSLPGVPIRANTISPDTILQSDRVSLVIESGVAAVTGPALISNIPFALSNIGPAALTYTPASGQVNSAATQIIPANWFAFHYTDGSNARMPVMPTIGAFPNAPVTPLFYTAATGVFSTSALTVPGGGTGFTTATAHGVLLAEGAAPFATVGPAADSVLLWQGAAADPIASVVNSCSGVSNALTYNTSTHVFGCNTITGGGGGGGGQINFPVNLSQRNVSIGASLTAANTLANSNTATTIFGTYTGRASSPAESMLPNTMGAKTVRLKAVGVVSTAGTNFALTLTVSLGGVTLGTITAPTIASLSSAGWELEYRYTVTSLTTALVGGCIKIVGTSSAALMGCSSGSATGLNFASEQVADVKATWTTASVSNILTTNQANIAVEQAN